MRSLTWLLPILASGCAAGVTPGAPPARSVRERLAAPTRLLVTADRSTGTITASHYTDKGWQAGTTTLAIDNGELDASVDPDGALVVTELAVSPAPIAIPASVFGQPAQLQDLRLTLAGHPAFATTWSDDDRASASATIDLDLAWSLEIGSTVAPLATQHLRGIPVEIALVGDGQEIDATIGAHARRRAVELGRPARAQRARARADGNHGLSAFQGPCSLLLVPCSLHSSGNKEPGTRQEIGTSR